jgi:hypothetical protein
MYVEDADADVWGGGWGVDSGAHESPVTLVTSVTTIPASAWPGSGEASFTVPASTALVRKRVKTVVTIAPPVESCRLPGFWLHCGISQLLHQNEEVW